MNISDQGYLSSQSNVFSQRRPIFFTGYLFNTPSTYTLPPILPLSSFTLRRCDLFLSMDHVRCYNYPLQRPFSMAPSLSFMAVTAFLTHLIPVVALVTPRNNDTTTTDNSVYSGSGMSRLVEMSIIVVLRASYLPSYFSPYLPTFSSSNP